jgi:hypothetical protein
MLLQFCSNSLLYTGVMIFVAIISGLGHHDDICTTNIGKVRAKEIYPFVISGEGRGQ